MSKKVRTNWRKTRPRHPHMLPDELTRGNFVACMAMTCGARTSIPVRGQPAVSKWATPNEPVSPAINEVESPAITAVSPHPRWQTPGPRK